MLGKKYDQNINMPNNYAYTVYMYIYIQQTCSQVSEVQVQVKSQVFEVKSKSSLKSLRSSLSQVSSL